MVTVVILAAVQVPGAVDFNLVVSVLFHVHAPTQAILVHVDKVGASLVLSNVLDLIEALLVLPLVILCSSGRKDAYSINTTATWAVDLHVVGFAWDGGGAS